MRGRGDNRWGTYNQILAAGGQVRKGERGTQVLFFTDRTARVAKDEQGKPLKDRDGKTIYEEEKREKPICKQYTVFNVEQADGLELKPRLYASTARMGCPPGRGEGDRGQRAEDRTHSRRPGLLPDRGGQNSAPGAVPVPHPQRLLPDGIA